MAIQTVTVTVNGQTFPLTLQENGKYEAELVAPGESSNSKSAGFFNVRVDATDTAGNSAHIDSGDSTYGNNLKLYTVEKVNPAVSISKPGAGDYSVTSTPELEFSVSDIGSGAQATGFSGFDTSGSWITVTLDGTSYSGNNISSILNGSFTPSSPNEAGYYGSVSYAGSFRNLSDGQHTVAITVTDKDGNSGTASKTFTVDTVRPELINVAVNGNTAPSFETNTRTLLVTGTATDVTGGVATVSITLSGVDQGQVTIGSGGAFEKEITVSSDGTYTIVVTATDIAGHTTDVTKTVIVDTVAPAFHSVTIDSQTGNAGRTYRISVSVS